MDWVLSTVSALLLAAAQPPWRLDAVAWIALVPLLWALDGKRAAQRLALGLWCGALWSCAVVEPWLQPALASALRVGPLAATLLSFAAAQVFGGVHVALFAWLCRSPNVRSWVAVLATAALWVAIELLRTHVEGAVPWTLLGHSQWRRPLIIQIADFGGVAAVSYLIAAVNVGLFRALASLRGRRPPWRIVEPCLVALALVALTLGYGAWRLSTPQTAGREIPLQVVHTSWQSAEEDDAAKLLRHMVDLASRAPAGEAPVMVWPENSLRFYVQQGGEKAAVVRDLVRGRGQYLLAGSPRFEVTFAGAEYFNSALLFGPDGEVVSTSDKRLLVPLAESRLGGLPSVERPFARGRTWEPFEVGDARLGVLICFEAIFPGPARRLVGRGAAALVNITNDQLVGDGAVQQAAMATFRAVENRVPLARVSNLGPTLVVDRFGRIEKEETGEGVFTANLRSPDPGTPSIYGRYGDLFAFLCILPAAWMVVMRTRRAN